MRSEFDVDLGVISLIGQLAERQAGHLRAIGVYLDGHTKLDDVGGLVMMCLSGRYNEGRQNACDGFEQGVKICDAIVTAAEDSRQAYMDADSQAVEAFRAIGQQLGISISPYQESSESMLCHGVSRGTGSGRSISEGMREWESGISDDAGGLVDGVSYIAKEGAKISYDPEASHSSRNSLGSGPWQAIDSGD